jgi:hypothetical protein
MKRTLKHKTKFRKTIRGGGKENNKMNPLPPSPGFGPLPPSPGSNSGSMIAENRSVNQNYNSNIETRHRANKGANRGVTIKTNADKASPRILAAREKKISNQTKKRTFWEKLRGSESVEHKVPLNEYGYPIKSHFNNIKNRGYRPGN